MIMLEVSYCEMIFLLHSIKHTVLLIFPTSVSLTLSLTHTHTHRQTHTHTHTGQRRSTGPLLCPVLRVCAMMAGDDWLPDRTHRRNATLHGHKLAAGD